MSMPAYAVAAPAAILVPALLGWLLVVADAMAFAGLIWLSARALNRRAEARFRQLADAMPQMVWTAAPDGSVDYHNQRWHEYTGLKIEESLHWGWQQALHPEDLPGCTERRIRAFAAGEAYEAEYRFRRAGDGAYRWHVGRASPIRKADGSIARWFGTHTDVDDYKRAEQEVRTAWREIQTMNQRLERSVRERTLQLRDSEERFRGLVEGVKDYAILMLDAQGRVTTWTVAAEHIKGYTSEEILGASFARFYTAEDIARGHPAEVLRAAEQNGFIGEQGWRVRKDGSRFWADVTITAMRDENGRLRGFSKITRDTTERRESDERIRLSEEKFRALLESAPDAVVIADGAGHIALVNAQAERMFGYDRQEMIGQPAGNLLPGCADNGRGWNLTGGARPAAGSPIGLALQMNGMRKNGEKFPVEVSLSPIQTGAGSWMAAAVRDISERKLAERQLEIARQRAEEANRAKSEFLAAMSHEIRTPMNAILGMSELLSETSLNDAQRHYLQVFRRAGDSLLSLIDNILDFSKIEAGRLDLEKSEFQLRDLIGQTLELVRVKAEGKGLELEWQIGADLPDCFSGDATRLRQVLINLLGNAIKFTDRGKVALAVQQPRAGPPGQVEFSVADTGIGIPPEQLDTIFEAFRQGDCSTTRKYGGSGLGLAISRRIVERMGGILSVASEVGKGATFRFVVALQPVLERRQGPAVEVSGLQGLRAALIDSNATNCLILREMLGSWGIETSEFAACDEALAEAAALPRPYAFVIVDSRVDRRMEAGRPHADGFEAAARIRAIVPELPVIMLSTDGCPDDEIRCREQGISGFAARPVSRERLLQLIANALRQSRPDPAAQSRPLRVLVAEDSPDNQLLVELYMAGGPHSLTFVAQGDEAVERVVSGQFDLVLMDLQMPVMDGLTATRAIRAMEREKGIPAVPILALSANARPQDVERSFQAGCTGHLSKPISKRRLLAVLGEHAKTTPLGKCAA